MKKFLTLAFLAVLALGVNAQLMKLHKETSVWKKALKSIKGQKTNKDRAEEWMAKAAKQGYLPAINHKW